MQKHTSTSKKSKEGDDRCEIPVIDSNLSTLLPVTLQPIGDSQANAVSARALYGQLGLDASQWARWAKKNIENNEFANEHEDWEGLDMMSSTNPENPKARPQPTKDYFLAIPFAKKLAMKANTPEGEKVRDYFLACEEKASSPSVTIKVTLSAAQDREWIRVHGVEGTRAIHERLAPKIFKDLPGTKPRNHQEAFQPALQDLTSPAAPTTVLVKVTAEAVKE